MTGPRNFGLLVATILILACGETPMTTDPPDESILTQYDRVFGQLEKCPIAEKVARQLTDILGAQDPSGQRLEMAIESSAGHLASAAERHGLQSVDLPTGYYYVFATCASRDEVDTFARSRWLPFPIFNAARAADLTPIHLANGRVALKLERREFGSVSHVVINNHFGLYFGSKATDEQLISVTRLFDLIQG